MQTIDPADCCRPSETSRPLAELGVETLQLRPLAGAPLRLLVALAHPDDESFGMGSTLARYAAEGVEVHYACATRGEGGEVAPELLVGYENLGALRTAELTYAASELGLTAVHLLGYRDSGMVGSPANEHPQAFVQAPLAQVTRQLVGLIRAIQPQVIVTFNPYGGYGHPDHIHIHQATLAAFGAAGDPAQYPDFWLRGLDAWEPQKLYFHTFSPTNLSGYCAALRLSGKDPRQLRAEWLMSIWCARSSRRGGSPRVWTIAPMPSPKSAPRLAIGARVVARWAIRALTASLALSFPR